MLRNKIYLAAACLTLLLCGCKEEKIFVFHGDPGINFLKYDTRNGWNEVLGNLYFDINFGTFITEWEQSEYTVYVQAKLEGMMSSEPMKIRLTYDFDPEKPHVEVLFRDDYALMPNEYITEFEIVVKRPPVRDQLFGIPVKFDYANSDIVAGAEERQIFRLNVKDEFRFEDAGISQDLWDNMIEPVLGMYSNTKLRFMAYALQRRDLSHMAGGVTDRDRDAIRDKLAEYNDAHPGNPLKDENGDIVTFEPTI